MWKAVLTPAPVQGASLWGAIWLNSTISSVYSFPGAAPTPLNLCMCNMGRAGSGCHSEANRHCRYVHRPMWTHPDPIHNGCHGPSCGHPLLAPSAIQPVLCHSNQHIPDGVIASSPLCSKDGTHTAQGAHGEHAATWCCWLAHQHPSSGAAHRCNDWHKQEGLAHELPGASKGQTVGGGLTLQGSSWQGSWVMHATLHAGDLLT